MAPTRNVDNAILQALTQILQNQQDIQQNQQNQPPPPPPPPPQFPEGERPGSYTWVASQLTRNKTQTYGGEVDPVALTEWFRELEKSFALYDVREEDKVKLASHFLVKEADRWWSMTSPTSTLEPGFGWDRLKDLVEASNDKNPKDRMCYHCKKPLHPGIRCFDKQIVCFFCNKPGHKANECPEKKTTTTPAIPKRPRGRIFVMSRAEAEAHPDIVTGTFLIFDVPCLVLLDTGASLSFISMKFSDKLPLEPSLGDSTSISLPSGDIFSCSYFYSDVPISITESIFPANLLRFPLEEFDVILGMDCPLGTRVSYQGVRKQTGVKLISAMKMVNALKKGHQAFLCVVTTSNSPSLPPLKDVPIVCEFPDVFPDELPGIPPERDVEFSIDLVPGTGPISKAPYHMINSSSKRTTSNFPSPLGPSTKSKLIKLMFETQNTPSYTLPNENLLQQVLRERTMKEQVPGSFSSSTT
ncbi:uncharacterized protein LOC141629452 [Silene latifolia]|uniref:uncharacterized protein LOC141629452 n=1 Tax=Silene latifolia TaxID=37657 RepID=UPI003D76DF13